MKFLHAFLLIVLLSGLVALGDYFLKLASFEKRPFLNKWFLAGCLFYIASTFGWVYVMPHLKLSALGMIYSLCIILMLVGMGVLVFGETLNAYEISGMCLGIAAIVLLVRFQESE